MPKPTTTRKRKQAEDMEVSPPKRVTRARAARTKEEPAPAAKTSKITKTAATAKTEDKPTASARSTRVTATTKRSTRSKDVKEVAEDSPTEVETAAPEPSKARGRSRKAVVEKEDMKVDAAPKIRGRAAKASSTKVAPAQATTRTRTRTTQTSKREDELMSEQEADAEDLHLEEHPERVQKKTARGRGAASTVAKNIKVTAPSTRATAASTRATGATASTTARVTATRKKVAFAEDTQDKENVPVRNKATSRNKKDEEPLATGLRAKPVRKATAVTKNTSRTRGAVSKTDESENKPAPLSPKKVIQVAKGNTSSSEDELGAKSPVRPINKSPIRPPASTPKEFTFLNSSTTSPTKPHNGSLGESLLARSPVRPPASVRKELPFAFASLQTPSKPHSQGKDKLAAQAPMMGSSLLGSPARRPPGSPAKEFIGLTSSPAKRFNMNAVPNLDHTEPQSSMAKSLLQSPARRLPNALKGAMTAVPKEKRALFLFGDEEVGSEEIRAFNFSAATPRRLFTNPVKILDNTEKSVSRSDKEVVKTHEENSFHDNESNNESDTVHLPADDVEMLDADDTVVMTPCRDPASAPMEEASDGETEQLESTTPPGLPSPIPSVRLSITKSATRLFREQVNDESEDELTSSGLFSAPEATPTPDLKAKSTRTSFAQRRKSRLQGDMDLGLTPLAHQLSSWLAASPEKAAKNAESDETGSAKNSLAKNRAQIQLSPAKTTFFEDEMVVRDEAEAAEARQDEATKGSERIAIFEDNALLSNEHNEFDTEIHNPGDKNTAVLDSVVLEAEAMEVDENTPVETADPLEMNMTPARAIRPFPCEVMTVSKIPLKSADDGSPTKTFRKKAKSLVPTALSDVTDLAALARPPCQRGDRATSDTLNEIQADPSLTPGPQQSESGTPPRPPNRAISEVGSPCVDDTLLSLASPLRTPRVGADAQILRGAVIYVDVHTTEGADASGIFVELLSQMGARCLKQWSWNPRASSIGARGETPGGSKVGITHVVFKDGGRRTLEKVREAKGLVSCVGVGWVLDCERENRWLDEADYAVDTTLIPRGGHNRRKSMEPRALANVNGTLLPAATPSMTPGSYRSISTPFINTSPTKEFLTFSASTDFDAGAHDMPVFDPGTPTIGLSSAATHFPLPETPAALKDTAWDFGEDPDAPGENDGENEPLATPYFMRKGAQLMQATCPPKQQTGQRLFPVTGRIEDEPDKEVRRRLFLARRKSLQWAPKVGSPLRRE